MHASKIIAFTLILLNVNYGFADNELDRNTLKGLKSISVTLHWQVDEETESKGISKEQILTDAEVRLRMAGISLVSYEEFLSDPLSANLEIRVGILPLHTTDGEVLRYIHELSVTLNQQVIIARPPFVFTYAATWSDRTIGYSNFDKLSSAVRDRLKDIVDQFINAYLSVNPKEQAPAPKKKETEKKTAEAITNKEDEDKSNNS